MGSAWAVAGAKMTTARAPRSVAAYLRRVSSRVLDLIMVVDSFSWVVERNSPVQGVLSVIAQELDSTPEREGFPVHSVSTPNSCEPRWRRLRTRTRTTRRVAARVRQRPRLIPGGDATAHVVGYRIGR